MVKLCAQCNKEFSKDVNISMKIWNTRVKYCSLACASSTRFQKGRIPTVPPEHRRRGVMNNKWKGGQIKKDCCICHIEFSVDRYREKTAKTCSRICMSQLVKTSQYRLSLSEVHRKRVEAGLHNLYRGATKLKELIRQTTQYKQWRESVYRRDNFTCQNCKVTGGKLNADHIKTFALILFENNVKTLDDAIRCAPLWDIENGRTLCVGCHLLTDTFGGKGRILVIK